MMQAYMMQTYMMQTYTIGACLPRVQVGSLERAAMGRLRLGLGTALFRRGDYAGALRHYGRALLMARQHTHTRTHARTHTHTHTHMRDGTLTCSSVQLAAIAFLESLLPCRWIRFVSSESFDLSRLIDSDGGFGRRGQNQRERERERLIDR